MKNNDPGRTGTESLQLICCPESASQLSGQRVYQVQVFDDRDPTTAIQLTHE